MLFLQPPSCSRSAANAVPAALGVSLERTRGSKSLGLLDTAQGPASLHRTTGYRIQLDSGAAPLTPSCSWSSPFAPGVPLVQYQQYMFPHGV